MVDQNDEDVVEETPPEDAVEAEDSSDTATDEEVELDSIDSDEVDETDEDFDDDDFEDDNSDDTDEPEDDVVL